MNRQERRMRAKQAGNGKPTWDPSHLRKLKRRYEEEAAVLGQYGPLPPEVDRRLKEVTKALNRYR